MELPALSQHEHALKFRAQRNQVLSSNIANADTPNYKARDIDFDAAMKIARHDSVRMSSTSSLHMQGQSSSGGNRDVLYRVPHQSTLDGNTVEMDVEQAAFAQNALQYRASLSFLDGQIRGLRFAIRGGE